MESMNFKNNLNYNFKEFSFIEFKSFPRHTHFISS